ncbi:MAG TPA: Wzz/FepE/Etk N-terminal domain-containing protein [Acidimicrobiales bacterium]|jgi:uncharacterized protein involved in exopolysaccharide biosynthesis
MTSPDSSEQTSGLRDYVDFLRRRRLIIIVVTLVFVVLCLAFCAISTPKYTATAKMLLTPTISPTLIEANGAANTELVDVPSDVQIIESSSVANLVAKSIPSAPDVTAVQVGTTDVVDVQVSSKHPAVAAAAATAYAKAYLNFEQNQTINTLTDALTLVQKHINTLHIAIVSTQNQITAASPTTNTAALQSELATLNSENTALDNEEANYQFYTQSGATSSGQILSPAAVPTKASSPKTLEWTFIALILGLVVGLGLALLVENLRPTPSRRLSGSPGADDIDRRPRRVQSA